MQAIRARQSARVAANWWAQLSFNEMFRSATTTVPRMTFQWLFATFVTTPLLCQLSPLWLFEKLGSGYSV